MTPGVFEWTMGSCNVCVPRIQAVCGCVCVGVVGGAIFVRMCIHGYAGGARKPLWLGRGMTD